MGAIAIGLVYQVVVRVAELRPEALAMSGRVVITRIVVLPVAVVAYRALLERSG